MDRLTKNVGGFPGTGPGQMRNLFLVRLAITDSETRGIKGIGMNPENWTVEEE